MAGALTTENSMNIFEKIHEQFDIVWTKMYQAMKIGAIAVINIGDACRSFNHNFYLFPNAARVTMGMLHAGFIPLPNIYWQKPAKISGSGRPFLSSGFLPVNAYVTIDCENILIFRKGGLRKFVTQYDKNRREQSKFTIEQRNKWFTQVWSDIRGARQEVINGRKSAAFPDMIPERLIQMFSVIGDVVLDPFLGTGTTAIVANKLHRSCIGIEIDKNIIDSKISVDKYDISFTVKNTENENDNIDEN